MIIRKPGGLQQRDRYTAPMRHLFLFALILLPACGGRTPELPAPPVPAPSGVPSPPKDTASQYATALADAWHYAADATGLHAAQVTALHTPEPAVSARQPLIPHADALTRHGVSWGLNVGGKQLLLPFSSGPRVRMGDANPHAVLSSRRFYDAEPWQRAAWRQLEAGETVVEGPEAFRLRFLGALRNVAQCRVCHDQDAPDALLGAWSYSLDEIADD